MKKLFGDFFLGNGSTHWRVTLEDFYMLSFRVRTHRGLAFQYPLNIVDIWEALIVSFSAFGSLSLIDVKPEKVSKPKIFLLSCGFCHPQCFE